MNEMPTAIKMLHVLAKQDLAPEQSLFLAVIWAAVRDSLEYVPPLPQKYRLSKRWARYHKQRKTHFYKARWEHEQKRKSRADAHKWLVTTPKNSRLKGRVSTVEKYWTYIVPMGGDYEVFRRALVEMYASLRSQEDGSKSKIDLNKARKLRLMLRTPERWGIDQDAPDESLVMGRKAVLPKISTRSDLKMDWFDGKVGNKWATEGYGGD
jgi:hypothetical protein